ncbi:serine hydrolase domain-containing protein [Bythopirellula polymerisocia]|uniref:Penicillin-binding protein 4 n=1 Tax=Bythopirellula polymerisocia TaxID=2528003 RepID=A0A5C6CXI9_9BACT|nr:serine hydrolase domain-containing protein [Bythopirellula polymerisocia]TWU29250.1 Penicillin-binding protein 4* [Bythopirellula polymerisocia]
MSKTFSDLSRSRLGRLVCLVLVMLLCTRTARADNTVTVEKVEVLLPPSAGAAVMAIDDGKVVFKHAWGNLRSDRTESCTVTTNFRLASVSKQFTATAILLLVDRGVIGLDDTLDRFFPECPEYWCRISVHHLLTHTSGLPDYEKLIPEGTTLQLTDLNVLELLRATIEPLFEPGAKFAYSNSGYALLGLIVEAAADRPFQDFIQSEIFEPTGMNRSLLYVAGMNRVPERAYGHELDAENHWIVGDQSLTSAVRGDGGVYSSLDDLQNWIATLDQEALLSDSSYTKMFSPHVRTDRGQQDYGYGWFLDTYRGERRVMHAGGTRGFTLMLQRFPDRHAAVVILLNRSALEPPADYVERIVDCLLFQSDE